MVATVATALPGQTVQPSQLPQSGYPDAWIVPRGALRVSFEPTYLTYDHRFAADGTLQPLGTDLSADSAGVPLIPTMAEAEAAVRRLTDDAGYRINAGAFRTSLDADFRRFPLDLAFGLTSRLTVTASLPVVTTRIQVDFAVDTSASDVGWNQAAPDAANAGALAQIQSLLQQLEAGAQAVEAQIAAGGYDCPSGPTCMAAQGAVDRARQVAGDLVLLTGVTGTGTAQGPLPPFAPLASSAAGLALLATIDSVAAALESFGAAALTAALPLPSRRVPAEGFDRLLTDPVYGYDAFPLVFAKHRQVLGDAELGLRLGAVQSSALRAVLAATVRLPTGTRDVPEHYVDLGTGDRQTDLRLALESVWRSGAVSFAVGAAYTLQLPDAHAQRLAGPDQPLAPASRTVTLRRDLGDLLVVSAHPGVRLSDAFTAYGSVHYARKGADRITPDEPATVPPADVAAIAALTDFRLFSYGGGVYYRSARDAAVLPIEAGIDYRAAFSGSDGWVPQAIRLNFFLRLYWRVFGGGGERVSGEQ